MADVQSARLVIKDYVRREDIDRIAEREGWQFRREVPAQPQKPYSKIWLTQDGETGAAYVEDALINVRYLEVRAYDLPSAVQRIAAVTDTYSDAEIRGMLAYASTPEQWVDVIHKAAVAAPRQFDPSYFQLLLKAKDHPDPRVREAFIEAAPYVLWREMEEPLKEMEKNDPDPEIRRKAGIMLTAMRKHNWRD
jgi:hypothetical protein